MLLESLEPNLARDCDDVIVSHDGLMLAINTKPVYISMGCFEKITAGIVWKWHVNVHS
jgi:hypothetical protein